MRLFLVKIIGVFLVMIGLFLVFDGCYRQIEEKYQDEEENQTETENFEFEKENIEEIEKYLTDKYNKEFSDIKMVGAYCLKVGTYNLSYVKDCSSEDVVNYIYKAKENDREFYIKKVDYDDQKIEIPEAEKNNELKGFYDNYIGYIMASKTENMLLPRYKGILGDSISVRVYEGFGISDVTSNNFLQYLDNSYQNLKDDNVSLADFVDISSDVTIGISIKVNEDITEENFKNMVEKVYNIKNLVIDGVFIDNIIIEYQNDNRYIEYDNDLKILQLKKGTDIYKDNSLSSNVYDRSICLNNKKTLDCISYKEFMDMTSLDFVS